MVYDFLLLFLGIILSFVLFPLWIWFVYKFQMGEEIREDGPQTHLVKRGTPTMGGFVIIFVVSIITFALNSSRTQTLLPVFIALLAGLFGIIEDLTKVYRKSGLPSFFTHHFQPVYKFAAGLISILLRPVRVLVSGFVELMRIVGSKADSGLQTYQKILIQGGIAGFVSYWTYVKLGWDYIWFPLVGDIKVGFLYPIIVFFLFLVTLNFVAFTDGLDGLAGGLTLIAFGAFWVIASALNYNSLTGYLATFIGALLPFLYFNVNPARIFMGNVGSHVFGATLALLGVMMHREVAMLIICAVFMVDGLSSPLQQFSAKLTGKRLFRMAPIHHHFEMLGWPETKVTFRFWILGIFCAFVGIFVALL